MTARPESEATLRTPSSSLSINFLNSKIHLTFLLGTDPSFQSSKTRQVTLRMTSYSIMVIMTRSSTLRRYQSRLWRTLILGLQNQMLR
ncbi:putative prolin-rich extensin-like receptor protein kinase family protein [Iris pallida]|uniref:Prolin-rich extensin-like receptor protein kinase family protein n=1 Tax=Iris pallida TaxID=29817 RepID=A0AAX6DVK7_IRIPA|nr:putative prolin-rich extensin-like receptor protein kinase family protein [Iris pallida]